MTNTDNPLLGIVRRNRYEEMRRKSGEKLLRRIGDGPAQSPAATFQLIYDDAFPY